VRASFDLYRRYPGLFFALAAAVVVPYDAIVLAATGAGPLSTGSLSFGVASLLTLIEYVLISPLVSALHVHAVREVGEGREPRLLPIARQGLRVLPVVSAAAIISGLGIGVGLVLLVVPGIILLFRWYVVAQTAAIEHQGWIPALRRSRELTRDNYGHIVVFALCVGVVAAVPTLLLGLVFGHDDTTLASFLVGMFFQVVTWSFSALAAGLLYFDLRAREPAGAAGAVSTSPGAPPAGPAPDGPHSWDPDDYGDRDRPRGWYVDPKAPGRMYYWGLGDPPGWGASTKTPRKIKQAWRAAREESTGSDGSDDGP
jgi:hypothetical protein